MKSSNSKLSMRKLPRPFYSLTKIASKLEQYEFGQTLLHFKNYFSADLATKALGLISIPVLTRLLSPADYGVVNVFNSYVSIFAILFTANAYGSVGRYFYEKKDDFSQFLGTSVLLTLTILGAIFLIFLMLSNQIASWLGLSKPLVFLLFPAMFFTVANSFFRNIYVHMRESKKVATISVISAYSYFGLSVFIILLLSTNLYLGPILARVLVSIVLGFWLVFFALRPHFKLAFKSDHIRYILSYSVPQVPYVLSSVILAQFDRIMINSYVGSTEAGLYSFAYNIGALINLVEGALFQAWMPTWFKYMDEGRYAERDADIQKIIALILTAAVFLMFFGKYVGILLAAQSFHAAVNVIPVIVCGYIFLAIFRVYGDYPQYTKKTYWLTVIFFAAGLLNVLLNIILIPKFGYEIAAYTTVISYFFLAVLGFLQAKYILNIQVTPLKLLAKPFALVIGCALFLIMLEELDFSELVSFFIRAVLFVSFCAILFSSYIRKLWKLR